MPDNVLNFVFLNEAYENSINTSTTRHDDVINDNNDDDNDDDDEFVIPENIEPIHRAPHEIQRQFTDEFVIPEYVEPLKRQPEFDRDWQRDLAAPVRPFNDTSHVRTNENDSINNHEPLSQVFDSETPYSNFRENSSTKTFTSSDKNDKTKHKQHFPIEEQFKNESPSAKEIGNVRPSNNLESDFETNRDSHGPDTDDFIHIDDTHDITDCKTPFHRHDSIIKDQLFEMFGMDSHGNIVCNIYNDDDDVSEIECSAPKDDIPLDLPVTAKSTPLKQTEQGFLI